MADDITHDQDFVISVDGTDLTPDEEQAVKSIRVDLVNDGPDYFEIGLWSHIEDPQSAFPLADKFVIGAEVEIKMGYDDAPESLFKGQVCGVEVELDEKEHKNYVNGFCKLHTLTRGRITQHWEEMKLSDIASDIASTCGLSGDAEATSETLAYVSMNNQTYLSFITDLARRVNYEVNADSGSLTFKKVRSAEGSVLTISFGGYSGDANVKRARISLQTAGQVTKVRVFAWDDQQKAQVIGEYDTVDDMLGGTESGPDCVSAAFGDAEYWISKYPASTAAEVDTVATSVFQDMAQKFVSLEAEIEGNPAIKPGVVITLEDVTPLFTGDYYVDRAIHVYKGKSGAGGGYITKFFASRPSWNP